MKKLLILSLLIISTFAAHAQNLKVHHTSGSVLVIPTEKVDSLTLGEGEETPLVRVETVIKKDTVEVMYDRDSRAVDLGLSVCWSSINLGAEKYTDAGAFFAWGELTTKETFAESTYKYYKYDQYQSIGKDICGTRFDTAKSQWGEPWRMPSIEEALELQKLCTWTPMKINNQAGYLITGPNGASIFLPQAGLRYNNTTSQVGVHCYYWTGSLSTETGACAYTLDDCGYSTPWNSSRSTGYPIRPVMDKVQH